MLSIQTVGRQFSIFREFRGTKCGEMSLNALKLKSAYNVNIYFVAEIFTHNNRVLLPR